MKFSFMKKFEEKEDFGFVPGDIVEFTKGEYIGEVCLIIYEGAVSLQDPSRTWDNLGYIENKLRKVPKGSIVTLTQE